jgi:hypothetical protein
MFVERSTGIFGELKYSRLRSLARGTVDRERLLALE